MVVPRTTAPAGAPRRIVLVDDHRMVTDAVAVWLAAEPDLLVVDRCPVADPDLLGRVAAARPDVVVVDVEPRGGRAGELVSGLVTSATGVLVLTASRDPAQLVDAIRAGAAGWLGKESTPAELVAAVRTVGSGDACLSPADLGLVLRALRAELDGRRRDPLAVLSRQERRVLAELVEGSSGGDIASALRVSEGTVRSHLQNVFGKLGVHSRLEAVSVARAAGLRPRPTG